MKGYAPFVCLYPCVRVRERVMFILFNLSSTVYVYRSRSRSVLCLCVSKVYRMQSQYCRLSLSSYGATVGGGINVL